MCVTFLKPANILKWNGQMDRLQRIDPAMSCLSRPHNKHQFSKTNVSDNRKLESVPPVCCTHNSTSCPSLVLNGHRKMVSVQIASLSWNQWSLADNFLLVTIWLIKQIQMPVSNKTATTLLLPSSPIWHPLDLLGTVVLEYVVFTFQFCHLSEHLSANLNLDY